MEKDSSTQKLRELKEKGDYSIWSRQVHLIAISLGSVGRELRSKTSIDFTPVTIVDYALQHYAEEDFVEIFLTPLFKKKNKAHRTSVLSSTQINLNSHLEGDEEKEDDLVREEKVDQRPFSAPTGSRMPIRADNNEEDDSVVSTRRSGSTIVKMLSGDVEINRKQSEALYKSLKMDTIYESYLDYSKNLSTELRLHKANKSKLFSTIIGSLSNTLQDMVFNDIEYEDAIYETDIISLMEIIKIICTSGIRRDISQLKQEFWRSTQGRRTFESYALEFEQRIETLNSDKQHVSEDEIIDVFVKGLNREIYGDKIADLECKRGTDQYPITYLDAKITMRLYGENKLKYSSVRVTANVLRGGVPKVRTRDCKGKEGHKMGPSPKSHTLNSKMIKRPLVNLDL